MMQGLNNMKTMPGRSSNFIVSYKGQCGQNSTKI